MRRLFINVSQGDSIITYLKCRDIYTTYTHTHTRIYMRVCVCVHTEQLKREFF